MLPDKSVMCHHTGFAKSCRECVVEHNCQKWTQVLGTNPQTGEDVQRWGCADSFLPLIMIENSQMQRQTGAAINDFRDEMLKLNGVAPAKRSLAAH